MCRIVGFAETMWKRELLSNNFHNLCSPLSIVYLLTIINTVATEVVFSDDADYYLVPYQSPSSSGSLPGAGSQ